MDRSLPPLQTFHETVQGDVISVVVRWLSLTDIFNFSSISRAYGDYLTNIKDQLQKWRVIAEQLSCRDRHIEDNLINFSLDLSYCISGKNQCVLLSNTLQNDFLLKKLDLSRGHIADDELGILAPALKSNQVLIALNLSWNAIGDEGAAELGKALKGNAALTTLVLQGNFIGDKGADAIAEALSSTALTSLDLGLNDLTEGAALRIVEIEKPRNKLEKPRNKLTSLGLARCGIGPTGAAEIAKYVSDSAVLTSLDLYDNDIDDEGGRAIGRALEDNEALTNLDLRSCGLGDEVKARIQNVVSMREGFELKM